MKTITLNLTKFSSIALEFDELTPDEVYTWSKEDFEKYQVPVGNSRFPLSNYFDIEVEGEAESPEEVKMILNGDTSRVKYIGCGMTAGEIIVNGDADLQAGAEMEGGSITIYGNAESYAGREMRGGSLEIMLFPHKTVFENIAFGLRMAKMPNDEIESKVNEMMNLLKIKHLANRLPRTLSGGEKQRTALARALIIYPRVLLMTQSGLLVG